MENEKWISRLENWNANSNLNANGNASMDAGDASANANMNGIPLRNRTPSSREVLSRMFLFICGKFENMMCAMAD
jgi:hypothetical protein